MKQLNPFSEGELGSPRLRLARSLKRHKLLIVLGGVVLASSGVVIAQNSGSNLPAPPTPPAPVAGAPAPPHDGLDFDGPGGPKGGPGRGPKHGPKGGPGGPKDGPRPTPPDANTALGASRSLERAYRTAGEVGDVSGDARDVAAAARSFYSRAQSAFAAKNYAQAFALAEGSGRLSRTARALSDASGAPLASVAGLTAPPVVNAPADDAGRAARELRRNFDEANRAANYNNAASNRYRALAETSYRAALGDYNAKRYDAAARRAHLGAEQAKAAREYAEVAAL